MSIEAMSWVLNHSPLQGGHKLVLLGIANHADKYGRRAWPSVESLADYANVSERQCRRILRDLEQQKAILTFPNQGGEADWPADRRPNRYDVVMSEEAPYKAARQDPERPVRRRPTPAPTATARGDMSVPPSGEHGGTPASERGDIGDRAGGHPASERGDIAMSPEPSLEPSKNQNTSSPASPSTAGVLNDEFATWWAQYPRKVAKAEARARYIAVRKAGTEKHRTAVTAQQLLDALDSSKRVWAFEQRPADKVPHASTWLEQRRFEDHLDDEPATTATADTPKPTPAHELCPDCGQTYPVGHLGEHLDTCPMGGPL